MSTVLRLLILEDDPNDIKLEIAALTEIGYACRWEQVKTKAEFLTCLNRPDYDLILANYTMPNLNGLAALEIYREHNLDIPFIFVSDTVGEDIAVECIKAGATDFVLKHRLSRLEQAVERALHEKDEQRLQQRVEAMLQTEGDFITSIINASPAFFVAIDAHGQPLMMNQSMLKALNYAPHEILGVDYITTFVPEEDQEQVAEIFKQLSALNQPTVNENWVKAKDGRKLLVEWHGQPIFKNNGQFDFFIGIGIDITKRKQAEETLRESKEKLRSTIASISDLVFVINQNGIFEEYYQPDTQPDLYMPPEVFIGNSFEDILPPTVSRLIKQAIKKVIATHRVQQFEYSLIINNEEHWYNARVSMRKRGDGGFAGVTAVVRNITERKQGEETLAAERNLLRTLIDNLPDYIYVKDTQNRFIANNIAHIGVLGATTQAEIIGKTDLDLFPPKLADQYYADEQAILQSGQALINQEEIVEDQRTGKQIWVSATKVPLRDKQGNIIGLVGISRDITGQKQAEKALRESEARFRRVVISISDHVYMSEVTGDGHRLNHYLSPNIETLTGYPLENFITAWSFWPSVVIHPDDRQAAAAQAGRLAQGQNSEVEYRLVRADGETIWVRDSARVERNGATKIIYGVVSNVTERILAQEEMVRLYTAERNRYREAEALRQTTLALVSTMDQDQIIEQLLTQLENVVPYDSASLQLLREDHLKLVGGRGFSNLADLTKARIPVNSNNPGMLVLQSQQALIIDDVHVNYPIFKQAPYNMANTRSWLGVPLYVGDRVIGLLTLDKQRPNFYTKAHAHTAMAYAAQATIALENARLYAETERRAQQLTVIHELDRAVSASLDINEVYQAFTQHTARLLAYDRLSIVVLAGNYLRVAYAAGQSDPPTETLIPRKGSTSDWVITHKQPVVHHDITANAEPENDGLVWAKGIRAMMIIPLQVKGQGFGTWNIGSYKAKAYTSDDVKLAQSMADQLAIAIENTRLFEQVQQEVVERKQAELALEAERASLARRVDERTAELSAANAELARAARLKDEFLANMSHELRTPLNAILGMSEVLNIGVYGELNDEQRNALMHIEEGGRHLLELINDILDLSKIEAGKVTLEITQVSIEDVCHASLRFIKQIAQKKQINTHLYRDEDATTLQADERRLKQILVNLLSNAVKFTPNNGEVGLEVTLDETGEIIHFTVWDTGIGISEEDMGHLFKPFVQIDSSLSRRHEGTGLGLSLVSRLTEMHSGGVSIESRIKQGSRFTVSLPRQHTKEERNPSTAEKKAETPQDPSTPSRIYTILLAEDNEANIATTRDFLKYTGYRVVIARNGLEAINMVEKEKPDIILMDIQMPEMDGLKAIRHIRADNELTNIPIIALTALAMPGDREQCLEAGADDYFSKPISMTQLSGVIEGRLKRITT